MARRSAKHAACAAERAAARRSRRGRARACARPATISDSPGRVFDWDDYQALKARQANRRFPKPDGSLFVGDKGMLTTGTYGEMTRA